MSSSMETAILLSGAESKRTTWRDIDRAKWEEKADGCPGKIVPVTARYCILTTKECKYETCFGRYWGMM